MTSSYGEASEVDGFSDLKEGEKEKVQRAWEAGDIPEDDKGPGEPVETGKKKAAAAPRKKKDEDGAEKPKRVRKPKVCGLSSPTVLFVGAFGLASLPARGGRVAEC